jgi:hypothetical protein
VTRRACTYKLNPNGSKLWHLKYRFADKEKRLAFGAYPEVTLANGREKQLEARRLLASGVDPGEYKKQAKRAGRVAAGNSFEAIGREWFLKFSPMSFATRLRTAEPGETRRPIFAALSRWPRANTWRASRIPRVSASSSGRSTDHGNVRTRCALRLELRIYEQRHRSSVVVNVDETAGPPPTKRVNDDVVFPLIKVLDSASYLNKHNDLRI